MNRRTDCRALRENDEIACSRCALRWDVRDENPPSCATMSARARDTLDGLKLLFTTNPTEE